MFRKIERLCRGRQLRHMHGMGTTDYDKSIGAGHQWCVCVCVCVCVVIEISN